MDGFFAQGLNHSRLRGFILEVQSRSLRRLEPKDKVTVEALRQPRPFLLVQERGDRNAARTLGKFTKLPNDRFWPSLRQ